MVQEGALLSPDVDEIYGLHLYNYHDLGYVGVKHGPIMASGCRFKIDVIGKGASWRRSLTCLVASSTVVRGFANLRTMYFCIFFTTLCSM